MKNKDHEILNVLFLQHHLQLPQGNIPHTALSFNQFRPNELFVALATNAFYIYDVEHKKLTNWSNIHKDMSHCRLLEQRDRIRGVAYNPAHENKMIIYGSTYMCLADIEYKPVSSKLGKRKQEEMPSIKKEDALAFPISHQYQQILYCGFIAKDQMVMIERPKFSVLENLPPSFYKAHFGGA